MKRRAVRIKATTPIPLAGFLAGSTEDAEYRTWAGDLARNTEAVVDVVKKAELTAATPWDFFNVDRELSNLRAPTVRCEDHDIVPALQRALARAGRGHTIDIATDTVMWSTRPHVAWRRALTLDVLLRRLDPLRVDFRSAHELVDARGAAKVVFAAADDPAALGIGLGARHRAEAVAGLGIGVVLRAEILKPDCGRHVAVGRDVGAGVQACRSEIQFLLLCL